MPGTIFSGTYTNGVVLSDPATQNPATVAASGYIANTGSPGIALYGGAGFAWTVANYGTIKKNLASLTDPSAVDLASGGSFVNKGVVYGGLFGRPPAIAISGGVGAVTNSGSITGMVTLSGGAGAVANSGRIFGGVYLADGGSIADASGAYIVGPDPGRSFAPAVNIGGAGGTVTNLGSMVGVGLYSGGAVVNGQSGSYGALISGPRPLGRTQSRAVAIYGHGTVTNFATIIGNPGIAIYGPGTVTNFGAIITPAVGRFSRFDVYISGGGRLANSGSISGGDGGVVMNGAGYISNSGVINGKRAPGVFVGASGVTIVNYRRIAGLDNGIVMDGAGYIGNSGMVVATGPSSTGVYLGTDGITLVNSGMIAGHYGIGVDAGDIAGNTVVNAGTIAGNAGGAIFFGPASDLLIVEPGAVFVGNVYASGSTIELAAGAYTGSLSGLGTNFAGFGSVRVDAGASWDISGGGSGFVNDGTVIVGGALVFSAVGHDPGAHGVIQVGNGGTAEFAGAVARGEPVVFADASGTVQLDRPGRFAARFFGFGPGDTIDLPGKAPDGFSFSNHQLILTHSGGMVADLHFAGRYTASDFALSPDGKGGTDITLVASVGRADFWSMRG
jgi:hypothetical protein